jgi:hypothetical protein
MQFISTVFSHRFVKRMKLTSHLNILKFLTRTAFFGVMFIALMLPTTRAAELVMFEQAGCAWCQTFDREIAPIYGKTPEGIRAPLHRVNIDQAQPSELAFIEMERLTPLFVLVESGREIGRIRGYPGEDHFWGLLGVLIKKLDETATDGEPEQLFKKTLRLAD